MTQVEDVEDSSTNEEIGEFPIPRVNHISNPQPAIQPVYEPQNDQFNPELFQLFFSLVNFHLPAYDLSRSQQFSPALETVGTAFEQESPVSPIMQEHIIRKFLIDCNSHMLELTSNPVLSKMAMLHNELFLASEFLRLHNASATLVNYCDMLMAETYDMFNSHFSKIVNEQFWDKGKAAEELINELLKKEIEKIRMLNNQSFEILSQCAIRRSVEKASAPNSQRIVSWAKDNEIPYQDQSK
ncbi:hypothetical protein TRFO_31213 [Tritrichomonas foetus]|uniref:Uncharacterized protein n=1 Tax=Tritrichomonas foetus TaxID=1144522 RepID=A0A1J4JRV4_9EUKA|nr:hypothetical protein TRFO_31213 [Tritrichomonas foetus]|eukprot:OHT01871.1 hypothetical protein TRFO_31213 [Tritrichomonas foetus]